MLKPESKQAQEPTRIPAPIVRNTAGLRDALFDEIDAIRQGKSNPTRANAVSKLATTVVESVRMEIEVQRHLRNSPAISASMPSQSLGIPLPLGNTPPAE